MLLELLVAFSLDKIHFEEDMRSIMKTSKLVLCSSLITSILAGFSLLASFPAQAKYTGASTIVCEDQNITGKITWSVKVGACANRNDTGVEIPRSPRADISDWKLGCMKGDGCQSSAGSQPTVRMAGLHCHVIGGHIICHDH